LFIGCSSKVDAKISLDDSRSLIYELAKIPGIDLVYGAFNQGLMGDCYEAFHHEGKAITGVMTEFHKKETGYHDLFDKEIVVATTTERFEQIYKNCDVLLLLPGGLGTYAELFSAIEEKRIQNGKKIIIYNDQYFYTPIIKELYELHQKGFIDEVPSDYMIIESDKDKIVNLMKEEMEKWKN